MATCMPWRHTERACKRPQAHGTFLLPQVGSHDLFLGSDPVKRNLWTEMAGESHCVLGLHKKILNQAGPIKEFIVPTLNNRNMTYSHIPSSSKHTWKLSRQNPDTRFTPWPEINSTSAFPPPYKNHHTLILYVNICSLKRHGQYVAMLYKFPWQAIPITTNAIILCTDFFFFRVRLLSY